MQTGAHYSKTHILTHTHACNNTNMLPLPHNQRGRACKEGCIHINTHMHTHTDATTTAQSGWEAVQGGGASTSKRAHTHTHTHTHTDATTASQSEREGVQGGGASNAGSSAANGNGGSREMRQQFENWLGRDPPRNSSAQVCVFWAWVHVCVRECVWVGGSGGVGWGGR